MSKGTEKERSSSTPGRVGKKAASALVSAFSRASTSSTSSTAPQTATGKTGWPQWVSGLLSGNNKSKGESISPTNVGAKVTTTSTAPPPGFTTTTTTTASLAEKKVGEARGTSEGWWSRLFSRKKSDGGARSASPEDGEREASAETTTSSAGSSTTTTTAASTTSQQEGEALVPGSPEGAGAVGHPASSGHNKNEVLIWKEASDDMSVPKQEMPPLRGVGFLVAGIILATFSSMTIAPVLLGALGTVKYIESMVERDRARRQLEDEEERYTARREIKRAKRRRLWLQTFYSGQAREAAKEIRRRKQEERQKVRPSRNRGGAVEKERGGVFSSKAPDKPKEKSDGLSAVQGDREEDGSLEKGGHEKQANP